VIAPEWRRICGVHVQDEGTLAAVWLAHDKTADVVHLYDCAKFSREVMAVIGEGLNARGRWIPIAWDKAAEDMSKKLLDRGCNMLPEPNKDSEAVAEVVSRDIWERMRTSRFKVDKRLAEWLDEYRSFFREDAKVPRTSHPLMSATRHAMSMLEYGRRQSPKGLRQVNYPKVSMV